MRLLCLDSSTCKFHDFYCSRIFVICETGETYQHVKITRSTVFVLLAYENLIFPILPAQENGSDVMTVNYVVCQ